MFVAITFLLREVNGDTWRQFKAKCALNRITLRDAVIALVERVVSGDIDLTQPKQKDKKK